MSDCNGTCTGGCERCACKTSLGNGFFTVCELPVDHGGSHKNGGYRWLIEQNPAPPADAGERMTDEVFSKLTVRFFGDDCRYADKDEMHEEARRARAAEAGLRRATDDVVRILRKYDWSDFRVHAAFERLCAARGGEAMSDAGARMSEKEFEALKFTESPFWPAYAELRRARAEVESYRIQIAPLRDERDALRAEAFAEKTRANLAEYDIVEWRKRYDALAERVKELGRDMAIANEYLDRRNARVAALEAALRMACADGWADGPSAERVYLERAAALDAGRKEGK